MTEQCTCGHTLDAARATREHAAARATAQQARRRIEAQQEAALAAVIAPIIAALEEARSHGDWPLVDAIKASLWQRSISVQITKRGIRWYR